MLFHEELKEESRFGKGVRPLPKIVVSPPSQENNSKETSKNQSSQSFKHGYSKMPSSTESPKFKPLAAKTTTVMESMMSKKISDSHSTLYEEYVPKEQEGINKLDAV